MWPNCTLKKVPQDSVSYRDTKVEQSKKVAMVAACTPSISVPLSR